MYIRPICVSALHPMHTCLYIVNPAHHIDLRFRGWSRGAGCVCWKEARWHCGPVLWLSATELRLADITSPPPHHARARLLQNLFNGHKEFNDDIGDWDVSKVTNFQVR